MTLAQKKLISPDQLPAALAGYRMSRIQKLEKEFGPFPKCKYNIPHLMRLKVLEEVFKNHQTQIMELMNPNVHLIGGSEAPHTRRTTFLTFQNL